MESTKFRGIAMREESNGITNTKKGFTTEEKGNIKEAH